MKHLIVAILISASSQQALSWGPLGHQASARIAWDILDPHTKSKINEILEGDDFVRASTWADSARAQRQWRHTSWFHFESAPDNLTYLGNLNRQSVQQQKLGGPIEALFLADDILSDPNSSNEDKKTSIKFMIHFIGDLHQPLHTGRVEDAGGNKIPVKWLGFDANLHQVWDSQIIILGHKDKLGAGGEEQSVRYANHLHKKFKDLKITPKLFARYDEWMHESMQPRSDAYKFVRENEKAYSARFIDIVDKRVYLAGLRIANSLQRILNNQPSEALTELRVGIEKIVGNFVEFLSLQPK